MSLGKTGSYGIITVSMSVDQYVSLSVSKHFFSKTAHMIFLKFHMKLVWPKSKIWQSQIFWKNPHFEHNAQK